MSDLAEAKLRKELRWAHGKLGCRCIFDDDYRITHREAHCPVHGDYGDVDQSQWYDDFTLSTLLVKMRDMVRANPDKRVISKTDEAGRVVGFEVEREAQDAQANYAAVPKVAKEWEVALRRVATAMGVQHGEMGLLAGEDWDPEVASATLIEHIERVESLPALMQEWHAFTVAKGWWNKPLTERIPRLLEWLHEEVDEAQREWSSHYAKSYTSVDADGLSKPEGLPSELVDIFLIVVDIIGAIHTDLGYHARLKVDYNKVRRYKRDAEGIPLPSGRFYKPEEETFAP